MLICLCIYFIILMFIKYMETIIENPKDRKITISGINNKYQMKKLISKKADPKKRVVTEKWDFSPDYYLQNKKQLQTLMDICLCQKSGDEYSKESKWVLKELERKLYGYKQQDVEKKMFETDNFVLLSDVIQKMIDTQLICYYCQEEMRILYEHVREGKQWTIDRDNNDKGHNKDNYVLACLDCNLKRKRRQKGDFLFTKQLRIVKENQS